MVSDPHAHLRDPDLRDVALALEGDEWAFARIMARNEARLRRQVSDLLRDRHLVEDVLQEVWSAAWRHLPTFSGRSKLHRWLRCIAAREASRAGLRAATHGQRRVPIDDLAGHEPACTAPSPAQVSTARDELRAALERLPANLPARGRRAFLLTSAGWSYAEVALLLGSPIGTVGTWVHRARLGLEAAAR